MDAKVKDNEELIKKSGNTKHWCTERENEVGPVVDPAGGGLGLVEYLENHIQTNIANIKGVTNK